MTLAINPTHDPALTSWVESANAADADFPVQNLAYGVFSRRGSSRSASVGVAIGDRIFDVSTALAAGMFTGRAAAAAGTCREPALNALMAIAPAELSEFRDQLSHLLRSTGVASQRARQREAELLVPMAGATLHVPASIGDYTDFYASLYHAMNVGRMFRPGEPLLPNYKHIPIGYHGRASSVVVSGSVVTRPWGQLKPADAPTPTFAPTRSLDYEAEVGIFVGRGNPLGETIPLDAAEEHLFGVCLVNDWSARDVQSWEYQPLGPFLAKSFATTVSPWVVTFEALAPFRVPSAIRPENDPPLLPYLTSSHDRDLFGLALNLQVLVSTASMRSAGQPPARITESSFTHMYWTPAQLLAHHASNGCNLRPGDLLGSGTVSGPTDDSRGCLLELTSRGAEPITLPNGEMRSFLNDGDEVVMRASCVAAGARRIGFGECRGVIGAAKPPAMSRGA